jgi:hypothetical protein
MRSLLIKGVNSPTQSGFVFTSITLLATEVYWREEIQVPKWRARKSPARAASP